jgi:hypothetical protein
MTKQNRYIESRIAQLREDMSKAHDEMDKAWYNRLIQELDWVAQMSTKPDHNCYMEKRNEHDRLMDIPVGATGGREVWT